MTSIQTGCLVCAWGNDIPEGDYCRACGYGFPEPMPEAKPNESKLSLAIKYARGGDAPTQFKKYA